MSTPTPTGPTPTPPGGELLPLISLAVEHVFNTLGRQPVFAPTILAVTADGQRGMWAVSYTHLTLPTIYSV